MRRVQHSQIGLPEANHSARKLGQAGVQQGLLGDDGGPLTQQAGSQQALGQRALLPHLACLNTHT